MEAFTEGPDVRSAEATVTVIVLDINDHSPEFEEDVSIVQIMTVEHVASVVDKDLCNL